MENEIVISQANPDAIINLAEGVATSVNHFAAVSWHSIAIMVALSVLFLAFMYCFKRLLDKDQWNNVLIKFAIMIEKAEHGGFGKGKGQQKYAAVLEYAEDNEVFTEKEKELIGKRGGMRVVSDIAFGLISVFLSKKIKNR